YHKRADLLLGDYYSLRYAAKQAGLPELETLPVPVNDNAVHLIFSQRTVTQADVALIDVAIQKLEAEGELRRIVERYALRGEAGGREGRLVLSVCEAKRGPAQHPRVESTHAIAQPSDVGLRVRCSAGGH